MINDRIAGKAQRVGLHNGYIIDTKKGVYLDATALNQQQFDQYFRTQCNITRPDLSSQQLYDFNRYYRFGEQLLYVKKMQTLRNLSKFYRLATKSYIAHHTSEIFGPNLAIAILAQFPCVGYIRTDVQKQKISEYGKKRMQNANKLGLIPSITPGHDPRFNTEKIADVLRERYGIKKDINGKITVSD